MNLGHLPADAARVLAVRQPHAALRLEDRLGLSRKRLVARHEGPRRRVRHGSPLLRRQRRHGLALESVVLGHHAVVFVVFGQLKRLRPGGRSLLLGELFGLGRLKLAEARVPRAGVGVPRKRRCRPLELAGRRGRLSLFLLEPRPKKVFELLVSVGERGI